MKINKSLTLIILLLLAASPAYSNDDFWSDEGGKTARNQGITPFPSSGVIFAGLVGYFNYSDEYDDDEHTAGFKISALLKDVVKNFSFRLDGLVTLGGPTEGLLELEVSLVEGLVAGLGLSHTKREKVSPRLGLYVMDVDNPARRGGIYLLENSAGIELGWPLVDRWSFYMDGGSEENSNGHKYSRAVLGMMYQF